LTQDELDGAIDVGLAEPVRPVELLRVAPHAGLVDGSIAFTGETVARLAANLLTSGDHDRACLLHDLGDVGQRRVEGRQIHLSLEGLLEVSELLYTDGLGDTRRTKDAEQLVEGRDKVSLCPVVHRRVPLNLGHVEDGDPGPIAQHHQRNTDAWVGRIGPRLPKVLHGEEVILWLLRLDDPESLAKDGRGEVDLVPGRSDHAYRRLKSELLFAEDPVTGSQAVAEKHEKRFDPVAANLGFVPTAEVVISEELQNCRGIHEHMLILRQTERPLTCEVSAWREPNRRGSLTA
jgi:hypothetical protein